MSFRLKIVVGVALIQAVLFSVMVASNLSTLKKSNEEALIKRSHTTVTLFASTTQAAVLATDLGALESLVSELTSNPDVIYARVLSKRGVLAESGDKPALARPFVADRSLQSAEAKGVFDAYADILVAGEKYGRVEIGFSTAPIERLIASTRNKSLALAAVSLLLMGLFSYFLGCYLSRGLNALQQGTQKIVEGNLGYQIHVRGKDELAATATAFNSMSDKLQELDNERQKKQAEIQLLNQELERRVIERTTQLQDANKQLEYQALHDALTRLPNRVLFHDRLRAVLLAAHRSREPFALVGVDLDLFKEINDTLGHQAGDLVLQHVADACVRVLRDSDTIARMGGDEFAILLPKVTDLESALRVSHRVLTAIKEPVKIGDRIIEVGASLGIALYPVHGDDAAELLSRSDTAMYEAKHKKLGVLAYDSSMGEGKSESAALKGELRHALNDHELLLHFQPKVDINSNRMSGVEALVRWQHPRLGLIYPDKFIGLAEMSGLIKPLTQEVLSLALQQLQVWQKQGYDFPIAVNISTVNLQDAAFPDLIASMLSQYGTPPRLLELEVTETAIMTEPLRAIENIRLLAHLGIIVSIDDFGTGYSSMAYLQKLLIAKIKIDKSFVMGMAKGETDEVIVRSTIDLAHNLGLKAVAEGVETQAAWDKLRELGCDAAQGYFMSKPLTAENLLEWIRTSPWGDANVSEAQLAAS